MREVYAWIFAALIASIIAFFAACASAYFARQQVAAANIQAKASKAQAENNPKRPQTLSEFEAIPSISNQPNGSTRVSG